MPRTRELEELYQARYDWRWALENDKAEKEARYRSILLAIAIKHASSPMAVWLAVREDYKAWRRENRLPPEPRNS